MALEENAGPAGTGTGGAEDALNAAQSAPEVGPSAVAPDREQIERYYRALLSNASEGGRIELRAFYDDKRGGTFKRYPATLDGAGIEPVVKKAVKLATEALDGKRPVVVSPIPATFKPGKAEEANIFEGLTLLVDLDKTSPAEGRATLRQVLGLPSLAVESGGEWTDPGTGEVQPRLHLYWLLAEPTQTPEEHAKLKRARDLACQLVGADASAKSVCHPIRLPGSVHRKNPSNPKLCRIVEENDTRIVLEDALAELEGLAAQRGEFGAAGEGPRPGRGDPTGDADLLLACAQRIPNVDLPWDAWNRLGMAFWRASGGSEDGFEAFDAFSRKSGKYDVEETRTRWGRLAASPPRWIGIGTLIYEARKADPCFLKHKPASDPGNEPEQEDATAATEDDRVQIKLGERWVNDSARRCARLLDDEMFMRGIRPAVLVRVEEAVGARTADDGEQEPGISVAGVRHARGSLVFTEPAAERIQFRLDEQVLFWRFDARAEEWVPKACPATLAKRIVGAATELTFRQCSGIAAVPLLINGQVIATQGYNLGRGVVLDLPDTLPTVPEAPTKADAERALEALLRPFRGYLDGQDAAATLRMRCGFAAAGLTAALRPSLPAAPAVLIDANVPGAGKGKAARALAVIATGRLPAVVTEGHAEEEVEKRLAAAILSGAPAILLDNLQRTLASSTLESGLTEGVATIRVFGRLEDITVPCSALVLVTANNAALRADMLRRTLPVRIVADTDQPELRRFTFDPYEEARAHRGELVAAALTIARAWWLARETEEARRIRRTTLGSFEAWADLVGGAVEWLTGMNPVALIEERKAADPNRGAERQVLAALWELFGDREWTAKEAVGEPGQGYGSGTGLDPDVWAPVIHFRGDRPTTHQVGTWLKKCKDRVFGSLQLVGAVDRKGIARWQVRPLPGVPGDAGGSSSQPRESGGGGFGFVGAEETRERDKTGAGGGSTPGHPRHPRQPDGEAPPARRRTLF